MAIKKITDEEIRDAQIQGNLPNRPTQKSLYPDNTLTAEEVKAAFDKLPKLVAARYNELVSAIIGTTNGTLNADNLASMMQTGIREGHTLNDLFKEIANGTLSFLPPISEDDNNKVLTVENGKWILKHFAAKEALPYFFIGQSGTIDDDAVFQKILNEKLQLLFVTDEETVVSMTPSALEDDGNILLLSGMLLDEENGKLYQIRILPDRSWHLNECPVSANPSGIGQDGKSAYEIALEHGFEGSEEEWLASLKAKSEILDKVTDADNGKFLGVENGKAKWISLDIATNGVSVVGAVLEKVSDDTPTLITFFIDGTSYEAYSGMSWGEWVESSYNTGAYFISGTAVMVADNTPLLLHGAIVGIANKIQANAAYTSQGASIDPGTPDTITFSIDGTSHEAYSGMSWGEWVESSYNTGTYFISGTAVMVDENTPLLLNGAIVGIANKIQANAAYTSQGASVEPGTPDTITFFIDGTSYEAYSGMTWGEWIESGYNTGTYFISGTAVMVDENTPLLLNGAIVGIANKIQANAAYTSQGANVDPGTPDTITFSIDGRSYEAYSGMSWGEWIERSYNTIGLYISGTAVMVADNTPLLLNGVIVNIENTIQANAAYTRQDAITFRIDGVTYRAIYGMTWYEWVNSHYNTEGFWIDQHTSCVRPNGDDTSICVHTSPDNVEIKADDEIKASGSYQITTC